MTLCCSFCHKKEDDYYFYSNGELQMLIVMCDDCRDKSKYANYSKEYDLQNGKCEMCGRDHPFVRTDCQFCEICIKLLDIRDKYGNMDYVVDIRYNYDDLGKYAEMADYTFDNYYRKASEWYKKHNSNGGK